MSYKEGKMRGATAKKLRKISFNKDAVYKNPQFAEVQKVENWFSLISEVQQALYKNAKRLYKSVPWNKKRLFFKETEKASALITHIAVGKILEGGK